MALVTSKQMLEDAQKGGYAVGAFNVEEHGDGKGSDRCGRGDAGSGHAPDHTGLR